MSQNLEKMETDLKAANSGGKEDDTHASVKENKDKRTKDLDEEEEEKKALEYLERSLEEKEEEERMAQEKLGKSSGEKVVEEEEEEYMDYGDVRNLNF